MELNNIYDFFNSKTRELTEQWYNKLDKTGSRGVYSSDSEDTIAAVKEQNHEFHQLFIEIFRCDEGEFMDNLESWIIKIAHDEAHGHTPIHEIIREFHETQLQYQKLLNEYFKLNKSQYSLDEIFNLNNLITDTMGKVIEWYTKEYNDNAERKLVAQQKLIVELSTPVIALDNHIALLPLVGEIDTNRARILLEKTLEDCASLNIDHLLLDLSGVVVIDTMVAHQIFQLIESLSLIGVKTHLSGIRPEIAQTAIQLGLNFNEISINSSLSKAIKVVNI
ncbi:rsbT co-antagonist protein RsbR [Gracilibacillus ureilyticus]|uniref:RsbT co-antagonist protein RsbR n=1 Tax=Gracilibacillus ureilyticus TaxID=531814 RepID=A0A1H9VSY1_9BACI|nr:STAS domain-containing protein [Gracilibacillus ureilyticus]SES24649.1 rsbT co-antagonist protein RsbR [Gracilibacillus ureilyticus]